MTYVNAAQRKAPARARASFTDCGNRDSFCVYILESAVIFTPPGPTLIRKSLDLEGRFQGGADRHIYFRRSWVKPFIVDLLNFAGTHKIGQRGIARR